AIRSFHEMRESFVLSFTGLKGSLLSLLRTWPTDRLSVADRGLREGILYAQMSADGVLEPGGF
ncbi:MAG: hypothetical protein AAF386_14360, partial [Pseudomonadota bacterium]